MCLLSQRLLLQQQYACHNKTSCDKRVMSQQISVTTKFCCNNFGGMWWGAMCYTFHISTIFHIKPHFQHSKPYHVSHHSTSNHISHIKSCQTIHVFHCNKSMLVMTNRSLSQQNYKHTFVATNVILEENDVMRCDALYIPHLTTTTQQYFTSTTFLAQHTIPHLTSFHITFSSIPPDRCG